jgi:hypothetical protein
MELSQLGRVLVGVGIAIAVLGGLVAVAGALGLGRLPGDVTFRRNNVRIYAPLATCLLISLILTVVLNLFLRR